MDPEQTKEDYQNTIHDLQLLIGVMGKEIAEKTDTIKSLETNLRTMTRISIQLAKEKGHITTKLYEINKILSVHLCKETVIENNTGIINPSIDVLADLYNKLQDVLLHIKKGD